MAEVSLLEFARRGLLCRLIQQGGFARGRDLPQLLELAIRRRGKQPAR